MMYLEYLGIIYENRYIEKIFLQTRPTQSVSLLIFDVRLRISLILNYIFFSTDILYFVCISFYYIFFLLTIYDCIKRNLSFISYHEIQWYEMFVTKIFMPSMTYINFFISRTQKIWLDFISIAFYVFLLYFIASAFILFCIILLFYIFNI